MDDYNVKDFIENHTELISEENFLQLYKEAGMISRSLIRSLTEVFLTAGINPLEYMNKVPSYFLKGSTIAEFDIPQGVTKIEGYAFADCYDLTSITIPNSVTAVEEMTFRSCANLAKVVLPAGITKIGKGAFIMCPELTGIDFKGTIAEWKTIEKGEYWREKTLKTVHCVDGDINL